jgi:competence protein ComEA
MLTKFFVSAAALLSLTAIALAQDIPNTPKPAPMATKKKSEPKTTAKASVLVSLNKATAVELESLPGIGPTTSARILEYRSAQGKFHAISELLEIKGIGEKKLAQLRPHLTLD